MTAPATLNAQPTLTFWFDFASTYAYLTACRIRAMGETAGVSIATRPMLLGPIFNAQGWATSPFNIYPAKGAYMVRDVTRTATARGNAFQMPDPFPANGLVAARIGMIAEAEGWGLAWTERVFQAEFAEGRDISELATLEDCLASVGQSSDVVLRSQTDQNKLALRQQTQRAAERGIFGAPALITSDGELFWGDDRLQQALEWERAVSHN